MGMSIDEAIYCMKSYLPSDEYTHCTECKYYGCKDDGTCASNKAHQMAIDTMRKYQKIKQIIQNTSITDGSNNYAIAFIDIKRVVEDGNN